MTTVVSNGQFWIYTFALLVFWIIVLTTALNAESNTKNEIALSQANPEDELKNTGICKSLCKHCGCLGFYCGEECICECNDDRADTECIRKIQLNAQSLNIPFEVLIQGPTANNFVRNALLFEQDQDRKMYRRRNKRSTVTVYKPNKGNQKSTCEKKTLLKDILSATDKLKKRRKRSSSNNQFNWFSTLGNNLLRPAPLGGRKSQIEESNNRKGTTVSSILDNSWIFESTRNILTPKPLNKLKSPKQDSSEYKPDSSVEAANRQTYDKLNDDYADDRKIDYNFSDELENTKINEKKKEKSEENLIDNLYSRLFKNDFNRKEEKTQKDYPATKDDYSEIEEDKMDLFSEEMEEKPKPNKMYKDKTGNLVSRLFNNELSSPQASPPTNLRKRLRQFRIPWLEPEKLIEKFKRVIS